jgi:hypothetical protein
MTKDYLARQFQNYHEITGDVVTPQMFGAVGDGVTDDTEAIQDALDDGRPVYFPKGSYLITDKLVIGSNTTIFGEENLSANMDFIESVLGKDIRKYFVKDFYKEHIQRYKKRPIYWLFSSPKGSFNALIYLHRYTPDTVSIVLNEYLRELMTKLSTRIKHLIEENNRADISNADKTRNLKQIDKYTAQLAELEDYERDVIFPLAQQKIAIDLDDGVKVNYCKFGAALKKIPGLEAKEE